MSTHFDPNLLQRPRPTSVLVIAILHLVGGGLSLLCTPFGLAANSLQSGGGGPQAALVQEIEEAQERNIPAFRVMSRVQIGVDLLLDVMMVAAGIGLIGMHSWARKLSLVYAWLSIALKIFNSVWGFGWALPGMTAAMEEVAGGNPQMGQFVVLMRVALMVGLVVNLVFIAYPIVVLILLTRPSIVAAFEGEPAPPSLPVDDLDEGRPFASQPERTQNPEDRIT